MLSISQGQQLPHRLFVVRPRRCWQVFCLFLNLLLMLASLCLPRAALLVLPAHLPPIYCQDHLLMIRSSNDANL